MVRKIKTGKIQINFSNRWLYTSIVIWIILIVAVGVYAFTGNVGHTSDQIDEVDPTVIASVKDGISWTEISGRPAGLDDGDDVGSSVWTKSGSNIRYDAGAVGIGSINPMVRLLVAGTGYTTGIQAWGGSYAIMGISYGSYGVIGNARTGVKGFSGSSGGVGVEGYGWDTNSCDFYARGAGSDYCSSSSIRWKEDVNSIDNALDKVLALDGVFFNWDEEHGGHHDIGMIAEDVGEYVPEVVNYEEDGIYAKSIDYSKLTPLLIEAIKEQQTQIEQLEARIEELEH